MIALASGPDFMLPPQLEAHEPPEARGLQRDEVRLLVSSHGGRRIRHATFRELPGFLQAGDLVVANDSATVPAALTARRGNREEIALHLSTQLDGGLWVVEPRKVEVEVEAGEVLGLPGGGLATILSAYAGSRRLWLARLDLPLPVVDYLHQWGRPISYDHTRGQWPVTMYQTIYAREAGSAEMPSAGRAFSPFVLNGMAARGIGFATLTLHTGVSSLEDHEPPTDERYSVPLSTVKAVRSAKARGGPVIAVGTTVVRALETVADSDGRVAARRGWTDLVITPERGVRVVDGLLTGFHEPESSHLAMLEAVAGREHVERAYREAMDGGYLWHEFGDLHLILP